MPPAKCAQLCRAFEFGIASMLEHLRAFILRIWVVGPVGILGPLIPNLERSKTQRDGYNAALSSEVVYDNMLRIHFLVGGELLRLCMGDLMKGPGLWN